ncbi:MAG: esterase [Massilia sp.]|nr:esterase [Massilia sp.]
MTIAGKPVAAHCQLTGKMLARVSPVDGKAYAIGFEMRLPGNWNGRFFYQANGGVDGSVVTATGPAGPAPLESALNQGFAVISSDAGHSACIAGYS